MALEHKIDLTPEEIDIEGISTEISTELGISAAISYVVNNDGTYHILVHDRRKGNGIVDTDSAKVARAASRVPKRVKK